MLRYYNKDHARETITLAWPLVVTQVGHILTGMVDNIFLGRLGVTEQAAGILSNNIYVFLLVFGIGMSYAMTPLVTEAHENSDPLKKASLFKNGLFLNFVVAVACFIVLYLGSGFLHHMGQPEEVATLAEPFFDVLIFSMLPMALFYTCKQYCEGLSNTRMALVIGLAGNVLNIILNYGLIYGYFGLPEMGYLGSAWASFFARLFMGLSFLALVFRLPLTKEIAGILKTAGINKNDLRLLWRIGWNSAMQFTFEVAAFVIAGLMAGGFGKEQIDAHGIALSIASFTYMFASGIASAATIRVGIFRSQKNIRDLKFAATTSLWLSVLVMGSFALVFTAFHHFLPAAFTKEAAIIGLAGDLLIIAAMFQLFDGMQVVLIGVLRALHDVKFPTVITLLGYWVIALPLAWLLAYPLKLETVGIWIALLSSLVFVALSLLIRLKTLVNRDSLFN